MRSAERQRSYRAVRVLVVHRVTAPRVDLQQGRSSAKNAGALADRLFAAWVEQVYHRHIHDETGQAPLHRWLPGGPFPLPTRLRWPKRSCDLHWDTASLSP